MTKILCYGARSDGHFNALLSAMNCHFKVDVVDDRLDIGSTVLGSKVVGHLDYKPESTTDYIFFIVGVGDNLFRKKCFDLGFSNSMQPFSIIHPSAVISDSAVIGQGSFIGPNVTIGASVQIGVGSIVNSNAVVEHDSIISDFCHIAPGCSVAGRVSIGAFTFLGIGSCIIPDITIGHSCIIGAGSTIVDPIPANTVAFGEKAKPKRYNSVNIYNQNV